jgi:hypothetical protein
MVRAVDVQMAAIVAWLQKNGLTMHVDRQGNVTLRGKG